MTDTDKPSLPRRFRKRWLWALALVLVALAINAPGVFALGYKLWGGPRVAALPLTPPFKSGDRLLVIAPHPDDESLCCAGAIQQAEQAGAQVYIVWMTSGDGFEFDAILLNREPRPDANDLLALGKQRMQEARKAAQILRIPPQHLYFLGFPDGGLMPVFLQHYLEPYRSRYTGKTAVPYAGTVLPGAAFTGANLEKALGRVIAAVKPTVVLAPSPSEGNRDHAASGLAALRVLGKQGQADTLRFYMVHGGLEWPLPKGLHPSLPLTLPSRGKGLPWNRTDLSSTEVQLKAEAIRAHHSQMLVLGRFMNAFVRTNELYSPEAVVETPTP